MGAAAGREVIRKVVRLIITTAFCATVALAQGQAEEVSAWPQYSAEQLSDPAFVAAEIEKQTKGRDRLQQEVATASELMKSRSQTRLRRAQAVLEALLFVKSKGYDPSNPELKKLEYFARKDRQAAGRRPGGSVGHSSSRKEG